MLTNRHGNVRQLVDMCAIQGLQPQVQRDQAELEKYELEKLQRPNETTNQRVADDAIEHLESESSIPDVRKYAMENW